MYNLLFIQSKKQVNLLTEDIKVWVIIEKLNNLIVYFDPQENVRCTYSDGHNFKTGIKMYCTECSKIYRKSVLHLLKWRFALDFGTLSLSNKPEAVP